MPALTADKVVVELEAKLDNYNTNILNAQRSFDRSMATIEGRAARTERAVGTAFRGIAAAWAAVQTAKAAVQFSDSATRIENSLKSAGVAGTELTTVYNSLYQSAQRNAAPIEALVQLYSRAAMASGTLKASQEEMLQFSDRIAVALRADGKSAQEASGALLQLSQALGAGTVRAEEFNSIQEGAPAILRAAAAGIAEAEGNVSKLRKMVVDGTLSSRALFQGFLAGSVILENQVAGATTTVAQGLTRMENSLINAAKRINEGSPAATELANEIAGIAKAIDGVNMQPFIAELDAVLKGVKTTAKEISAIIDVITRFRNAARDFGAQYLGQTTNERVSEGFKVASENPLRGFNGTPGVNTNVPLPLSRPQTVKPIKASDYPADGKDDKAKKARLDAYQRENVQIQERIKLLEAEAQTVGLTTFEQDKQRAIVELQNAAKRAGITLTDEQNAKIYQTATAYAAAAEKVRELEDKQRAANELANQFGNLAISSVEGLADGSKKLNDVLADTLKLLARMALQAAFLGQGPLAGIFGTAPTTAGGVGGLFGGLASAFGGARAAGGPVKNGSSYLVGEKGPEMFVPGTNGTIVKNSDLTRQGTAEGGGITMFNDFRDSSADAIAVIMQRIDRLERNLPRISVSANKQALDLDPYALG